MDEFSNLVEVHVTLYAQNLDRLYWEAITKGRSSYGVNQRKEITKFHNNLISSIEIMMENYVNKLTSRDVNALEKFEQLIESFIEKIAQVIDAMTQEALHKIAKALLQNTSILHFDGSLKLLAKKKEDKLGRQYSSLHVIKTLARHFAVLAYVKEREMTFKKNKHDGFVLLRKDGSEMGVLAFKKGEYLLKDNMHFFHPNSSISLQPFNHA